MNKLLVGLLGFAAALGAGAFFLQRETNDELRTEIAGLRGDLKQLAKQQSDAAHLLRQGFAGQGAPTATDARMADEQRVELAKLREQVAALTKSTREAAQIAQAAQQAARGESPIPVKLIPANEWKNAGRATPNAAVETLLWAAAGGDVDTLSKAILLDASAQTKAQALFARLPEAAQAQYGSPDNLIALMIAKDGASVTGMQILGQRDLAPDIVGVRVRLGMEDDGKTQEQGFGFKSSATGLQLIVTDKLVDRYAGQLSGRK